MNILISTAALFLIGTVVLQGFLIPLPYSFFTLLRVLVTATAIMVLVKNSKYREKPDIFF